MGTERKTVLRAGAGFFYDRVSLLAATFPQNPTRAVTLYNQVGLAASRPAVLQNAYLDFDGGSPRLGPAETPAPALAISHGMSKSNAR